MSQLALGTIGRSRSLINQSQESLDPGDHYDHSDREEELHQQDADDEDESGLVSGILPDDELLKNILITCILHFSSSKPNVNVKCLFLFRKEERGCKCLVKAAERG